MASNFFRIANKELDVDLKNKSIYGEYTVVNERETVSGNAVYGFLPSNFRTFNSGSGSAGVVGNLFNVQSGTSLGDYGTIRSFRSINYRTGQGASVRFSGKFNNSEALTWQGMGAFNVGDEMSFGYNGTSFGIWHRYNGLAEVRKLQITNGAGGSETASVTINGVLYSIPITSGTVQKNAHEIETYLNDNATILAGEQTDDTVTIEFLSDGAKTDTYSFSSTGTATGTWTRTTEGVTKTSDFIAQADWNKDKATYLDPSKGNNYMIRYQNGFGVISYFVQNEDCEYTEVHCIRFNNKNTTTNLYNPSLHIGNYATALSTVSGVSNDMAYTVGLVNGGLERTRNPRAYSNTKSIGSTLTNIFTIRNTRVYNGYANQIELQPLDISISNEGSKTAVFEIRGNATIAGTPNYQNIGTNLITDVDVAGTTVTGGRQLVIFDLAPGESRSIDLRNLEIAVPPSLRLTIAGRLTSGGAGVDLSAALTWYENI